MRTAVMIKKRAPNVTDTVKVTQGQIRSLRWPSSSKHIKIHTQTLLSDWKLEMTPASSVMRYCNHIVINAVLNSEITLMFLFKSLCNDLTDCHKADLYDHRFDKLLNNWGIRLQPVIRWSFLKCCQVSGFCSSYVLDLWATVDSPWCILCRADD